MPSEMRLTQVLAEYEDGNDTGWPVEFAWLWMNHAEQMVELIQDVIKNGIQEPILLGPDGSIWDGHHRIAAAVALGLDTIPTTTKEDESD